MSQGAWGLQPPQTRAKSLFFGQKLNFSGRSQQLKNEEKYFFVFIKQKTELILSSEIKCPKSGFLLISGWGESGKVILQVILAAFSGTVEKFFGQRWLNPLEKIDPCEATVLTVTLPYH